MATTLSHVSGRRVHVVPELVVQLSKPLFKASPPHNGRILRVGGRRHGPIIRSYYGTFR